MYKSNNNSRRFNNPNGGGYSKPRFYARGNSGRQKQKSLPNDPALFIKKATAATEDVYVAQNSFDSFNFSPALKANIEYKGYTTPTPIQDQTIGHILEGKDLIGLASTGTGKTAAFLLPVIQLMYKDRQKKTLIITPTRELALQIDDQFYDFAYDMKLYATVAIGGTSLGRQIHELRSNPHCVIATPGRLKDLIEHRAIDLSEFSIIILDEVDLMVDIGFINDVKYFISLMRQEKQALFFSATISNKVTGILQSFVHNPVTVSIKKQDSPENVEQDVVRVSGPTDKIEKLHDLLISDGFDKVLIFGRTKHGIENLNKELFTRGFKVGAIHGNKNQNQRSRVLESFKKNEIQILLATDVASRGLDIDNVTHVINYELPETYEDYVHRIGRTGRANQKGVALTFIS